MALLATTAAVATAACLNSVLGVSADIQQLRHDRASAARLQHHIERLGDRTTLYHLLELADPHADAVWFEGRAWNYGAMKRDVDRLAVGLGHLGVAPGDYVAVYMTNSPEMVFVIYAISKLGAAPALISSALRDDTLSHCVKIANASTMICTPDLAEFAANAIDSLGLSFQCLSLNLGSFQAVKFEALSSKVSDFVSAASKIPTQAAEIDTHKPIPRSVADVAVLLYTSGTTGKPKACCVRNLLICITSCPTAADLSNPRKYFPVRTYSCMPLFHGTTFLTGLCYSVGTSGTFCLARRFSASRLWQEVAESRATRLLYVGELCRYLCAAPPSRFDRAHGCIVATGNGLQKDVWPAFMKRFAVPEIREYYRSTEGLAKYDNRNFGGAGVGKVGYAGLLRRKLEEDVFIVRFDYENERPLRDPRTGFCVLAALGEPGEAIGRIKSMAVYTDYLGNKEATEAKILRDVFEKGDLFQRSGDLMVQERLGWIRFHDRIGETFRWKGENVSAGEVSGFICELPEVQDAIVFGKRLSGYDGQAGAAAITLKATVKDQEQFIKTLYHGLKRKGLPEYAFPRLVMITNDIAINATFKHAKQALKAFDWNPELQNTTGSTYWLDRGYYKPLTKDSWTAIESGRAKL